MQRQAVLVSVYDTYENHRWRENDAGTRNLPSRGYFSRFARTRHLVACEYHASTETSTFIAAMSSQRSDEFSKALHGPNPAADVSRLLRRSVRSSFKILKKDAMQIIKLIQQVIVKVGDAWFEANYRTLLTQANAFSLLDLKGAKRSQPGQTTTSSCATRG